MNIARIEHSRWLRITLLTALIVVGFLIRFQHISDKAISDDEAFSWRVTERPFGTMVRQVVEDTHPLLHFLVLKAVLLSWGSSLLALRAPSLVAGVATIWVVNALSVSAIAYSEGRKGPPSRLAGWAGLAAAAYVALHPLHDEYSKTARMYAIATFLAGLSAWLLLLALRESPVSRWRYATYATAAALLMHTHHYGIFLVAGQFLFAAWASACDEARGVRLRALFEAGVLTALLYAPWLPAFLMQAMRVREGFWIPRLTRETLLELVAIFVSGASSIAAGEALIALAVVGALIWGSTRIEGSRHWVLPIQALVPWICAFIVSTAGGRPVLQERYVLLAIPAFAGWFAIVIAKSQSAKFRALLAVNLLASTAIALLSAIQSGPASQTPIIESMAYLRKNYRSGDVIVVRDPATVNVFQYYASRQRGAELDIRYFMEPTELKRTGQADHLSSLAESEIVYDVRQLATRNTGRLWVMNHACDLQTRGWEQGPIVTFGPTRGQFSSGIQIVCYTKHAVPTQADERPQISQVDPRRHAR